MKYKLAESIVVRIERDDCGLLYNLDTGVTKAVNPTAAFICSILDKATTMSALKAKLKNEFSGFSKDCENDLNEFIAMLKEQKIILEVS